jgi:hypothetical protein
MTFADLGPVDLSLWLGENRRGGDSGQNQRIRTISDFITFIVDASCILAVCFIRSEFVKIHDMTFVTSNNDGMTREFT